MALDVGRCARDITTEARQHQRAEAESLKALANGLGPALYLVDPAVLAWMDAPIIAPREIGPKFTRISGPEAEALLSAAKTVVWDTSFAGAEQTLRRLAADPATELARRGFALVRSAGPVRVYSRAPM